MTQRIVDCAYSSDGSLYAINEAGEILHRDPEIGVGFGHLPVSARPQFIWHPLHPAPSFKVKRLFAGDLGKLLALDDAGQLHERLLDRTSMRGTRWYWQTLSPEVTP